VTDIPVSSEPQYPPTESTIIPVNPVEPEEDDEEEISWSDMTSDEQLAMFEQKALSQFENVSFEDALKEAVQVRPEIEVIRKRSLVDVPFIVRRVRINMGEFGPFVSLVCVTEHPVPGSDGTTVVINDGSTGIARQVVAIAKQHGTEKPLYFPKGLRESVYYIDKDTRQVVGKQPKPNSIPASTFYFNA
jgi:hypothetical protein